MIWSSVPELLSLLATGAARLTNELKLKAKNIKATYLLSRVTFIKLKLNMRVNLVKLL